MAAHFATAGAHRRKKRLTLQDAINQKVHLPHPGHRAEVGIHFIILTTEDAESAEASRFDKLPSASSGPEPVERQGPEPVEGLIQVLIFYSALAWWHRRRFWLPLLVAVLGLFEAQRVTRETDRHSQRI